jgi:oligopeptide/dipeptide ABC transporter ATP-binding protein
MTGPKISSRSRRLSAGRSQNTVGRTKWPRAVAADRDAIYSRPRHPYTEALLSAVPIPDPQLQRRRRRIVLAGEIPDPLEPPRGCRFQSRCPCAKEACGEAEPPLEQKAPGHWAACWVRA